jgi:hypothetical protein
MIKNVYENGDSIIEVRVHKDGYVDYWVQVGQAGLILDSDNILDLTQLLNAVCTELLGEL